VCDLLLLCVHAECCRLQIKELGVFLPCIDRFLQLVLVTCFLENRFFCTTTQFTYWIGFKILFFSKGPFLVSPQGPGYVWTGPD
jgi:hypothetical protein